MKEPDDEVKHHMSSSTQFFYPVNGLTVIAVAVIDIVELICMIVRLPSATLTLSNANDLFPFLFPAT